ncbi:hypothetical protein [Verminephrobacter eiseniae]|uniref:hypothetical protein n=1 Tax=Verminephrobacter eiseniae TaxID=364317 RepID=UPI002238D2F4|nr:hypothetical protein [Verminephrobacter eiseniae]
MSRHRSSVGLRWPSKRIAALHRLPIRSVLAARCALRCAPMAARSLRHLIRDATLAQRHCAPGCAQLAGPYHIASHRAAPQIPTGRLARKHFRRVACRWAIRRRGRRLSPACAGSRWIYSVEGTTMALFWSKKTCVTT